MYVRKSERAASATNSARYSTALRLASQAWGGPQFEEDDEGRRVRIWGNGYEDWVRDEDVRAWLKGARVVEDLRDGLEFCREAYIANMVKADLLRKDPVASYYWITEKAAEKFGLEVVMGKAFPK